MYHIETVYANSLDPNRCCILQAELIVTTSLGADHWIPRGAMGFFYQKSFFLHSDGATQRMSLRSVSNENRFQYLVYRESKITYHIPDKQLKLSQKHKCGDFMWLNTVMSLCV